MAHKKHVVISLIVIMLSVILLFPMTYSLDDGGTVEYDAILYSVRKEHSINGSGYNVGIIVRVLFWEVYNDVEYIPGER